MRPWPIKATDWCFAFWDERRGSVGILVGVAWIEMFMHASRLSVFLFFSLSLKLFIYSFFNRGFPL